MEDVRNGNYDGNGNQDSENEGTSNNGQQNSGGSNSNSGNNDNQYQEYENQLSNGTNSFDINLGQGYSGSSDGGIVPPQNNEDSMNW